jgi:hypothetical protein
MTMQKLLAEQRHNLELARQWASSAAALLADAIHSDGPERRGLLVAALVRARESFHAARQAEHAIYAMIESGDNQRPPPTPAERRAAGGLYTNGKG